MLKLLKTSIFVDKFYYFRILEQQQKTVKMEEWSQRTQLLLGTEVLSRLSALNILVLGVGGVGAYAAEMLVRAGVGSITIIDGDEVNLTNLNRQLLALNSTLGERKVKVMAKRLADINPGANIESRDEFVTVEGVEAILAEKKYDYVVDAIDTVAPKVAVIEYCMRHKIKIISSMGAGGRMDPTKVQYGDISETYNDGLAKVVRTRLKDRGLSRGLKVVWSSEPVNRSAVMLTDESQNKRSSFGTVSYMPCVFGCMLAAFIINKEKRRKE